MTRKQQRLIFLGLGLACLGLATSLMLYAIKDNLVFFHDPSAIHEGKLKIGQSARIGGLVQADSFERLNDKEVRFRVTDTEKTVTVLYKGLLPDLFREGQGVVANGALIEPLVFRAEQILAKHDENYMPKEVSDALKGKGQWKPESQ